MITDYSAGFPFFGGRSASPVPSFRRLSFGAERGGGQLPQSPTPLPEAHSPGSGPGHTPTRCRILPYITASPAPAQRPLSPAPRGPWGSPLCTRPGRPPFRSPHPGARRRPRTTSSVRSWMEARPGGARTRPLWSCSSLPGPQETSD